PERANRLPGRHRLRPVRRRQGPLPVLRDRHRDDHQRRHRPSGVKPPMTDIVMPKLSDSMEQGTIISWFKSTGNQVEVGDELWEFETDKTTVACDAEAAGVLEILAPVGATVQVGQLIARVSTSASAERPATRDPDAPPLLEPVLQPAR